jgi:hypothetical protein
MSINLPTLHLSVKTVCCYDGNVLILVYETVDLDLVDVFQEVSYVSVNSWAAT